MGVLDFCEGYTPVRLTLEEIDTMSETSIRQIARNEEIYGAICE